MSQNDIPPAAREPAFRVPRIIIFWRDNFDLSAHHAICRRDALVLIVEMALFPARFFAENMGGLPGGRAGVFSLVSYGFLHGGWSHCLINLVWLLAFGAPVAHRLGARQFLALYQHASSPAAWYKFSVLTKKPGSCRLLAHRPGLRHDGCSRAVAFPKTAGLTRQPQFNGASLLIWGAQTPTRNDVYRRMGRHCGVWAGGPLAAGCR